MPTWQLGTVLSLPPHATLEKRPRQSDFIVHLCYRTPCTWQRSIVRRTLSSILLFKRGPYLDQPLNKWDKVSVSGFSPLHNALLTQRQAPSPPWIIFSPIAFYIVVKKYCCNFYFRWLHHTHLINYIPTLTLTLDCIRTGTQRWTQRRRRKHTAGHSRRLTWRHRDRLAWPLSPFNAGGNESLNGGIQRCHHRCLPPRHLQEQRSPFSYQGPRDDSILLSPVW